MRADTEPGLERDPDFFRTLVETSEDVIVVLDEAACVTYASPAVARSLGYETIRPATSLWDFVHPEDQTELKSAFARALAERRTQESVAARIRHQDGSWREMAARAGVVAHGTDTPLLVVNARDVTERRRGERELRETRDVLDGFVRSAPLGMMLLDIDGNVRIWNPALERIFGWTAAETVGRPFPVAGPAGREGLPRRRGTEAEASDGLELERRRKDGSPVTIRVWARGLCGGDGRLVGTVAVVEDVTEKRRIEEGMIRAEKLESLGVLAGGVAHDFNNILGTILGNASLALTKLPEASPARGNVDAIVTATERAAELSHKMLAFSGRGQFQRRRLELDAFLAENRPLLEAAVPKEVRLELACEEPDLALEGDPGQLGQALLSLVLNAVEAIGGRRGRVRLACGEQRLEQAALDAWGAVAGLPLVPGRYVRFSVEDDGAGIEPGVMPRIFEPFFTTRFTGRGLGLAAVLGIVRGHGGGIRVESEPGRGTRVDLLFPAASAAAPRAAAAPARSRGVLVVDDEASLREVMLETLAGEGIPAWGAGDGASALRLLQSLGPAVGAVVLDLSMPGMSGDETLREIRARAQHVRVALTSGYAEAAILARLAGARPDEFLQKPYRAQAFLETVGRLLDGPPKAESRARGTGPQRP